MKILHFASLTQNYVVFQLNRPTSFASSSASELNGFVDNRQLPAVYTTTVNHTDSEKDTEQESSKSSFNQSLPKSENQTPSVSVTHAKPTPSVELSDKVTTSGSKSSEAKSIDSFSRNFSFDNKEIESLKNRRVSLCVPSAESDNYSETRRASSPFTNGGTELLIGPPHDEHRLKTTAIIEDSRRSSKDLSNR